ncbi:T9SS type A sorting domain-containing protein [Rhodocytophaga rosea]|uniref:T9SS type A sorting domain-containing protein n=1 Tax=Rhodocytophaga rosea TaxID=2704465 RepID=A0A6C0GRV4_9BACT|nr:T9SS type A sorting domain-containing protein [Rhodocytophaga rosea]QHT70821.1 T9SS type A sorting domain-containing protein [Rhodocytophaga rosea]
MHYKLLPINVFYFFLLTFFIYLPVKAQFVSKFGSYGTGNGQFDLPISVDVDAAGNIYVVDYQNHRIQKFDPNGKFLLKFGRYGAGNGQLDYPTDLAVDIAGNIYVVDWNNYRIQKFNSNGQFLLKFGSQGNGDGQFIRPSKIAVDIAGNVYVTDGPGPNNCIQKFNSNGKFLMKFGTYGTGDGQFNAPTAIAVDVAGNIYVADYWNYRIQKFNANGQFLSKFGSNRQFAELSDITIDVGGNIYVADYIIKKFNSEGQLLSGFGYPVTDGTGDGELNSPRGVAVDVAGNIYVADMRNYRIQKFYIGPAISKPNHIKGSIFNDKNADCVKNADDNGLANLVVIAQPGNYYATTDSLGNYTLAVDIGNYTIQQVIPYDKSAFIKQICPIEPKTHSVKFTAYNDSVVGKDFANQISIVPYLSVSVSSDRRRRCMTNNTTVTYCNNGTADATNVKVYVKLPEYVLLRSASLPYTQDNDSNYVFSIGSLAAQACGSIEIQDLVICDNFEIMGLTQCTKAWITPANDRTASDAWDQSDIHAKARCTDNGRVRLGMYNMGNGSMADSSSFRIYLDTQLAFIGNFKLAKGDSLILQVPANGQTVRLEADQLSSHPSRKQSFVTIEACGINSNGTVSVGFVNQQTQEEEEPEIATECLPIIDSFDPNDKAVSPQGIGNEHYTPTKKALDYVIRFQNTGTDVAYKVVVVDTLSNYLDISTLQVRAVSHAYKMTVSGKGKPVLTFTFNNINLPDSTKDQLASNGYIRFSIKPKEGLPEKIIIKNYADIFFDFNKPVRTNITFNTIYDIPLVVVESAKLDQSIVCKTTNTSIQAGISRSICEQDTVVTQAIVPLVGKGRWKLISGRGLFQDIENATTIISGLAYGENIFEWSISANSCGSDSLRAQITITRQKKPNTPIITQQGTENLVCNIVGSNYEWFFQGVTIDKHTQSIQVSQAGLYMVKVSNQQGCWSDASAAFKYILPCYTTNTIVNAGINQTLCEQDSIILQAVHPMHGRGNWKLVSGQGEIQDTQAANSLVKGLSYGENVFEWKVSSNTCIDSLKALVTITRIQKPITPVITQLGADSLVCNVVADSYEWQLEGEVQAMNSQRIKVDSPGKYTVRVKNQQGCVSDLSAPFNYVLTSTESYLSTLIKIYPNPTNDKTTIILPAESGQKAEISVWDALGRNIMIKNLISSTNQYKAVFDLSSEKTGIYIIKIQTTKGIIFKRIIKN